MNPLHLFDIETNGFLDVMDRIHLLVVHSVTVDQGGPRAIYRHNDDEDCIADGARFLMDSTLRGEYIVGHNIIKFDIPALQKLYPWFRPDMRFVIDTIVLSRAIYPDTKLLDALLMKKGVLPKSHFKKHSLEAWGYRLGVLKDEYAGDPTVANEKDRFEQRWVRWNQTMEDYCVQDVAVTEKLLNTLQTSKTGRRWFEPEWVEAVRLEHVVQSIVARQERRGFLFDKDAARELLVKLTKRKLELEEELRAVFPPFQVKNGKPLVPKRDNAKLGYVRGVPVQKYKTVIFNPGSRDHVALMLQQRHGWQPEEFTNDGKPKVDETILGALPYSEAKPLTEYFTVAKRLGQLSEGKEAWLKNVNEKTGRVHGGVVTNGAVTGRMTHLKPNMAQVPAARSPYGHECRALFVVPYGWILVGADADALELRCLAHFMARYDGGAYIKVVLEGKKELGTDIHSVNARALGMDPKAVVLDGWTGRDLAKTWFYAFIYGAGDEKLGLILTGKKGAKAKRLGAKSREDFMANLPALGKLVEAVRKAAVRGYLRGIDGRIVAVRSQHSALNTLLQSAGAVLMKRALVILDRKLQESGLVPGVDYEFVANVHDEWQVEALEHLGERIGKEATQAIVEAGEHFHFRCPLAGAFSTGKSWAATH